MNQSKETRSTIYWQIIGLIAVALLAYMFFPFIDVIIYGIFIYYVARPIYRAFDRRFKHKNIGAFLSLFIVVLPIVLISIYTASIAYIELTDLLTRVDSGYIDYVNELFKDYGGLAQYVELDDFPSLIGHEGSWGSIIALLTRFSGIITTFFGIFFNLFLTFAIAFYLLKDGTNLRAWFTNTFPGSKTELATRFFDAVDSDLHTVFLGNILTAILTALIGAVTFSFLNLVAPPQLLIPYPILLAILCGLGIFIPLIGMKVVWIPLAIYIAIQAYLNGILVTSWWFLLLFLILVSVVVDFVPDTILRPLISRKQIHAGAMLFAYIFGIATFGFVGLFLGPMILILATQFMKIVQPALWGQRSAST